MEILNDFDISVKRALEEIDPHWALYDGLIIAGSWPGENDKEVVEECKIKLRQSQKRGIPVLGICLGHQVIGLEKGYTLEKLPKRNIGIQHVSDWWGERYESFWHDYMVVDENGFKLSSLKDEKSKIISVQYHPEYQSSKDKPHPILVEFLELCKKYTAELPRA